MTTFRVEASPPPLLVTVTSAPQGQNLTLLVTVRTPEGLPVANASIDWTLNYEPPPLPIDDGTVFGKPDPPPPLSGSDITDDNGALAIVILPTPGINIAFAPLLPNRMDLLLPLND